MKLFSQRKLALLLVFTVLCSQLFAGLSLAQDSPQFVENAIGGQVLNKDAIGNVAPLSNVTVEAFEVDEGSGDISVTAATYAVSAGDGSYQLDLYEGLYVLEVTKEGSVEPDQVLTGVWVNAADPLQGFDIEFIEGAPRVGVTGRIEAGGMPLDNVTVEAYLSNNGIYPDQPTATGTAVNGEYDLDLAPGEYMLEYWQPDAMHPLRVEELNLPPNTLRYYNVFVHTGISGNVTDAGNPVADMEIRFFPWDETGQMYSDAADATVTTDVYGHYSANLEPGKYLIDYHDPSINTPYMHSRIEGVHIGFGQMMSVDQSVAVDAARVGFQGKVDVPGAIDHGGVTVNILDSARNVLQTTTTDMNGHYTVNIASGSYEIEFVKTGYPTVYEPIIVEPATWHYFHGVTLVVDGQPQQNGLSGVVKNANGDPLSANIMLFEGTNLLAEPYFSTRSNDTGEFIIPDSHDTESTASLPVGDYTLMIAPDFMSSTEGTIGFTPYISDPITFDGTPIDLGDIVINEGSIYTGHVDNQSGTGVGGVPMFVMDTSVPETPEVIGMLESFQGGGFAAVVPGPGAYELWILSDLANLDLANPEFQKVPFPSSGSDFGGITLEYAAVEGTVTGQLFKSDGTTQIPNADLVYARLDANGQIVADSNIREFTNVEGMFGFTPDQPGTYKFIVVEYAIGDQWHRVPLNTVFTVDDAGQLFNQDGILVDSLTVTLPEPNFSAIIMEKGVPIANAWVEIERLGAVDSSNGELFFHSKTDANGLFELILQAGEYQIRSLGTESFWQELHEPFVITDGVPIDLTIDLAGNANVTIEVMQDNVPVSTVYGVSVGSELEGDLHYHKMTNAEGKAYFELPPGTYKIFGLNDHENNYRWIHLDRTITVTDDHTVEAPLVEVVNLKSPNLTGQVLDVNGQPVAHAWVQFIKRSTDLGNPDQFFGTEADAGGNYQIYLEPGTYVVDGYHVFDHATQTGEFVRIGKEIVVDVTNLSYNIQPAVPNLTGILFTKGGVEVWPDVEVIFMPIDKIGTPDHWKYEKRAKTDENGRYSIFLPEGQYRVEGISTRERWVRLDSDFTVTMDADGNVTDFTGFDVNGEDYSIAPPPANVRGVIVDFNGDPLTTGTGGKAAHAWVSIGEKVDWSTIDPDNPVQPKHYGTEVRADGSFELSVEPGTYILFDVSMEIRNPDGTVNWTQMPIQAEFAYDGTNPVHFGEIGPNVRGTVSITGQSVDGVIIRPQNLTPEQRQNPWKYDRWASVNDEGTFELYLDPSQFGGAYEVFALAGPGLWVELSGETFTVPTDSSITIETITISMNVTGTVKDKNGNPVKDAHVEIRQGSGQNQQYYGARTDTNGQFKLNLDEGEYAVRGIHTYNPATGTGKYTPVNYPFAVDTGGQMRDGSGNALDQIVIQPNISGIVKKSLDSNEAVSEAWVTLKPADAGDEDWSNAVWIQSDASGQFSLYLAPGDYKVVDIGGRDFWKRVDIQFSVNTNGALSAVTGFEDHIGGNQLIVAPPAPNLTGTAYDKQSIPLAEGWISIKPADASDEDWNQFRWFTTDSDGNFNGFLENGRDYVVTSISSPDFWAEVQIPFTLSAAGVLTGPTVMNGQLTVKPPQPNVRGMVEDEAGNPIANGWIGFKPKDSDAHDWTKAKWTETDANGAFALRLEPGDYVIPHAGNGQQWVNPKLEFTIEADGTTLTSDRVGAIDVNGELTVAPPQPNVTGVLYKDEAEVGDDPIGNGSFSIVRINDQFEVLNHDGAVAQDQEGNPIYVSDREKVWPHTYWFNTDDQGAFKLNLDEGTYYVLYAGGGANGQYVGFEPGTVFDAPAANLEIRPPAANFSGTVNGLDQGELDKNDTRYWLKVVDTDMAGSDGSHTNQRWIPIEDDGEGATDGTGQYAFTLPPGNYAIEGVSTPYGMEALNEAFTIDIGGNVTKAIDLSTINFKIFNGRVTQGGTDIMTIVTVKLTVTDTSDNSTETKLIQTDDQGRFTLKVKEGFTYDIEQVITDAFIEVAVPTIDYDDDASIEVTVDYPTP